MKNQQLQYTHHTFSVIENDNTYVVHASAVRKSKDLVGTISIDVYVGQDSETRTEQTRISSSILPTRFFNMNSQEVFSSFIPGYDGLSETIKKEISVRLAKAYVLQVQQ